jgi:hypothetical protein
MATLALAAAGAAIGGATLGTGVVAFGMTGTAIGWSAGLALGGILFPPNPGKIPDGPRLQDKKVTVSTYGSEIPRLYGTARLAGNVIWSTDLIEKATENEVGGKGGGGSSYTTYSYSVNCAVSICRGPITGVIRIWADGFLIYDASIENEGPQRNFDATHFKIYTGTEDQMPDSLIESFIGATPAYRGQAYVVFGGLELEKFGNRIPSFTFEAVNGVVEPRNYKEIVTTSGVTYDYVTMDPMTGYLWQLRRGGPIIDVIDPFRKRLIATMQGRGDESYTNLTYDPQRRIFFGVGDTIVPNPTVPEDLNYFIDGFSADSYSLVIQGQTTRDGLLSFGQKWIFFNPATRRFYIGSTLGFNTELYRYDENLNYLGSPFFTDHYHWGDGIYIEEFNYVVLGDGRNLTIYDAGGTEIQIGVLGPVPVVTEMSPVLKVKNGSDFTYGPGKFTYDSLRKRIAWTAGIAGDGEVCVIDLRTLTVSYTQTTHSGVGQPAFWVYQKTADLLVSADWIGVSFPTTIKIYDPETFELIRTINETGLTGTIPWIVDAPYFDDRVYGPFSDNAMRFYLTDAIDRLVIPLSTVIEKESEIAGLLPEQVDASMLEQYTVWGYAVTGSGSIRGAIEPLMSGYQFDAVESSGVMKFVPRSLSPTIDIEDTDLAQHDFGSDTPEALPLTRSDEIELPRSVTVRYQNPAADYQMNSQAAYRTGSNSRNDAVIELPMVITDEQAKNIAEVGLYSAWAARTKTTVSTSIKYGQVEPTDLIRVKGNLIRVLKRSMSGNKLVFDGEFENGGVYVQNLVTSSAFPVGQSIFPVLPTTVEFMDIPMLRDQDNDAGFYVAAKGFSSNWPGCQIFKSIDGGTTWNPIMVLDTPAEIGSVVNELQPFEANTWDDTNTVTVYLRGEGNLYSATTEAVLNGANAAVIGDEIIQFRTATQIADNGYILSGLLRGRRGTSSHGHRKGDRFVLLSEAWVRRVPMDSSEIGVERLYKAVTLRDTLNNSPTIRFVNTAKGLEPYSPVKLAGGRDGAGNLRISWIRRTRIGGGWRDLLDVPIGEETQSYSVEIYNESTLVRTLSATTTNVTYTAAQQVEDFGSPQASVSVVVYQNSALVGGGFTASGSI